MEQQRSEFDRKFLSMDDALARKDEEIARLQSENKRLSDHKREAEMTKGDLHKLKETYIDDSRRNEEKEMMRNRSGSSGLGKRRSFAKDAKRASPRPRFLQTCQHLFPARGTREAASFVPLSIIFGLHFCLAPLLTLPLTLVAGMWRSSRQRWRRRGRGWKPRCESSRLT